MREKVERSFHSTGKPEARLTSAPTFLEDPINGISTTQLRRKIRKDRHQPQRVHTICGQTFTGWTKFPLMKSFGACS